MRRSAGGAGRGGGGSRGAVGGKGRRAQVGARAGRPRGCRCRRPVGRGEAGPPRDPGPRGQAAPACCGAHRPPAGRLCAARGALPLSLGSAAARFCAGRAGRVTVKRERRSRHLPPAPQSPSRGACFAGSKLCVRGGWERGVRACLRLPQGNF